MDELFIQTVLFYFRYNLNFMNGNSYSKPFAFLNLDKHWRYVLNGPFIDTSFMRNTFSFHFHKLMGGLSPKYQYVNVFINNEGTLVLP